MRAAIYARLSREDVGNVDNTDIQVAEAGDYIASREGWRHVGTFVDNNISAYSNARRPDYEALFDLIRGNNVDVIVSTEAARLNRRLRNSIGLFRMAESTALKHIATTDGGGFDLSTPEGIHNAINVAIEAEKEALRTSRRQKRKKRVQAKEGMYSGGPRPFGYEADGATIREGEAAIVREIVKRLVDGDSSRSIVHDLRRRGIKTATGREWHIDRIARLLESPRICGIRSHNGVEYPAQWPAIVPREQWEQARLAYKSRGNGNAEARRKAKRYLLTGIASCGECGTPMIGSNYHDTRRARITRRYRCPTDDGNHHQPGCGKVFRSAEPLDILVTEAVLHRLDSVDFLRIVSAQAHTEELGDLLNQYEAQKTKLKDLIEDYASGLLDRQQLGHAKSIVEEALEATRARLAQIQSGRALARLPLDGSLRDAWQDADLDFQRDVIQLLVSNVIVKSGRTQGLWRGKYRFDPNLIEIQWKA
jgi:site-specific DNA recombinase